MKYLITRSPYTEACKLSLTERLLQSGADISVKNACDSMLRKRFDLRKPLIENDNQRQIKTPDLASSSWAHLANTPR